MNYDQIVSILVSATAGSIITSFVNYKITKKKLESDIKLKFKDYEHEKKLSAKQYLREEEVNLLSAWGDIINIAENYNVSDVLISIYPDLRKQTIKVNDEEKEKICMRYLQTKTIQIADDKTLELVALFYNEIYSDKVQDDHIKQIVLYSKILASLKNSLTNDNVSYQTMLMIKLNDYDKYKNKFISISGEIDAKCREIFGK